MGSLRAWLQRLGYLWLVLASAFVLTGIADLGMRKGWSAVGGFLNPTNALNWAVIAMTFLPGVLLLRGGQAPKKKEASRGSGMPTTARQS